MMDYTKAPTDHDQTKCFILVDKGAAEIVQTILDFFNHMVIPHACCEGGGQ